MSSSSSVWSALRGRSVAVPLIGCPDCGRRVTFFVSNTEEHDGWVFYKCPIDGKTCDFWKWELDYVEHLVELDVIVGDDAVEAIGKSSDKREELELAKAEKEKYAAISVRRKAGGPQGEIGVTTKGRAAGRMTKLQASMLLALGKQMVVLMKCVLLLVVILCVLLLVLILKK